MYDEIVTKHLEQSGYVGDSTVSSEFRDGAEYIKISLDDLDVTLSFEADYDFYANMDGTFGAVISHAIVRFNDTDKPVDISDTLQYIH